MSQLEIEFFRKNNSFEKFYGKFQKKWKNIEKYAIPLDLR